ncbi:TIGR04222 domain-containing membrane protein [Streptomyces sp. LaPpAH-108]|uniref:TIGR04222 domain-containing membrane protein n=1 Tax=Streptomyces sp. LaPpAH-108 TaxID=1155714 RepID=UPI000360CF24|nr:TIGR04222 domain-containing membrane protein [Streptomyces sp. LaPpAH-108]
MFWVLLLLLAWGFAGFACTRLCLAAGRAGAAERAAATADDRHELTLYEAAYLSGGPARVADLAMVRMARQRRLLLAHTGWATVVNPRGHDEMERFVIAAVGPGGQSRIAPVRAAAARSEAIRHLGDRLEHAGLAVPAGSGSDVASAVRLVRAAALAVLVLAATALLLPSDTELPLLMACLWFLLPLLLTLGFLLIARFELRPYTRWASPAGQRLLGALTARRDREGADGDGFGADRDGGESGLLTSLATRGIRALAEPELRAAFNHRDQPWRE